MISKFFRELKDSFCELIIYDFKYLLGLLLIVIVCFYPLNYYIVIGGGISDIGSRVKVEDGYKSKGSFNISYVTETDGVLFMYLLSYIMPNWTRESVDDYKYSVEDSIEDIQFRNDLSLKQASNSAMKVAYDAADVNIETKSIKYYVLSKINEDCSLEVGDQLLSINGVLFESFSIDNYPSFKEGDYIDVVVMRNGKKKNIKTKLYMNHESNKLYIGIYISRLEEFVGEKKTDIKFKSSESGPSGGVITALSIYNQLVREDITHGLTIAGTGTIDSNGVVGEIGGVEYKLRGAVAGGADVFIVPSGDNYKDCIKLAHKEKYKIKIIEVKTFDEAIQKLKKLG